MRGINRVMLSGNVTAAPEFGNKTGDGAEVCGFTVASDRYASNGQTVTAFVKVNVYPEGLVRLCRDRVKQGDYLIVDGELMNRDGRHGTLLEVRARDIIFGPGSKKESR